MTDHPNKASGLKDQVVGALKEGAGKVIASDKMKAEGKLQKEGGKAEVEAAKAEKLESKHETDENLHDELHAKDLDRRSAAVEHERGKEKEELGKKTGDKALEKEGKEQKKIGRDYIEDAIHREKQEGRVDRMEGAAKKAVGKGLDDPLLQKEGEHQKKVGKAKIEQTDHKHKDTHVIPADKPVVVPLDDRDPKVIHHRVDTFNDAPAERIVVHDRKRMDIPVADDVAVVHHHNKTGSTEVVHTAPTTTEVIHPSGDREVIIPRDQKVIHHHQTKPIVRLIETDEDKHKLIVPPPDTAATHVVNDKDEKDYNRKEGTADQFAGRAKEHLGKVLGDKDMIEEGKAQRKDGKKRRKANQ